MAGFLFLASLSSAFGLGWACPKGQAIRYKSSLRSGLSAAVLHALPNKLSKPRQDESGYQAASNSLYPNTKFKLPSRLFFTKKYYLGTENSALVTLNIDAIVRLIIMCR